MTQRSLEDKLQAAGGAVGMARNSQIGPYVYPAVPAEFSNWRDEQVAWRETSALFDQSHHMLDLQIEGPDTIELLSHLGVNTFESFMPNKAKQLVVCNHDGYVIGDAILFHLDENRVRIVGRPSAHNWVQYHAETGGYDVQVSRDERTAVNPTGGRELYRFQVQGPTAMRGARKGERRSSARDQVLQHGRAHDRRASGARPAPRDVGRAGARALGPVGRARGRPRRDRRGRPGLRASSGRRARLRDEHARVRLDPLAAPGDLHGRRARAVPGVAAGRLVRGHRLARRQLRLRRHRGLLPHAVGSRIRLVRQVRPRLRRTRGARGDGASPSRAARSRSRGTARTSRVRWGRSSRRATRRSTSTSRSRTTRPGRTTA